MDALSDIDRRYLAALQKKLQVVRDCTAGVVRRSHTGFFIGGRGGIGKSYNVESQLTLMGEPYKIYNSAMTPRFLFDRLAAYPDSIHLFEDVETIAKNPKSIGILRSAFWGTRKGPDGTMERLITWGARGSSEEVIFTGGIIMTANRRLAELPELDALKTRITYLNLVISDAEVTALMRSLAMDGWPKENNDLEPEKCREVVEFIVEEASRTNRRLDVRLMVNSYEDRLQFEDLDSGCDWRDLVSSRIRERPTVIRDIEPVGVRSEKKARQLAIAREITNLAPEERLRVWHERTGGLSQATLYRRLTELARTDALTFES